MGYFVFNLFLIKRSSRWIAVKWNEKERRCNTAFCVLIFFVLFFLLLFVRWVLPNCCWQKGKKRAFIRKIDVHVHYAENKFCWKRSQSGERANDARNKCADFVSCKIAKRQCKFDCYFEAHKTFQMQFSHALCAFVANICVIASSMLSVFIPLFFAFFAFYCTCVAWTNKSQAVVQRLRNSASDKSETINL